MVWLTGLFVWLLQDALLRLDNIGLLTAGGRLMRLIVLWESQS